MSKKAFLNLLPTLLFVGLVLFMNDAAIASGAGGGGGGDGGGDSQTLGAVIKNVFTSSSLVPGLFAGFCYLCGLVLGFMAIMKLKAHAENPNNPEIWDPLKRFLAGGLFFSLPYLVSVVVETVSKDGETLSGSSYNTGGATSEGLDGKLVALMRDVWEPMQYLMLGFCYLAGIIFIIIGVSRLLKTEQEGPKGPTGFGTIMMFLTGGILLSINNILGAAVNSVFQSGAENNAALTYTEGLEGVAGNANAVIGAVMAFIAILGWISFIRGFFIMKDVAHGNGNASAMAGITHIIGGAVAVNLGGLVKAVQATLGIEKYGLTISAVDPAVIEAYMTTVTFIV
jgi:hypothetical protein